MPTGSPPRTARPSDSRRETCSPGSREKPAVTGAMATCTASLLSSPSGTSWPSWAALSAIGILLLVKFVQQVVRRLGGQLGSCFRQLLRVCGVFLLGLAP